jgi:prevent-host-death family protein
MRYYVKKGLRSMTTVSMTEVRHVFTELADQVRISGERICISKNNKPALALVPLEDVRLLEMLEDMIDLKEALEALKETGGIDHKAFKKKLGL